MRIAPGLEAFKLPSLDWEVCKYANNVFGEIKVPRAAMHSMAPKNR
jgi:hypothetical protein